MIVFDLKCSHNHKFEAWFGSSDDYEDQKARGLVSCPLCDDVLIEKAVMAPAVAAKGSQRRDPVAQAPSGTRIVAAMPPEDSTKLQAVIEKLVEVQAGLLKNSSWVGNAFADRARAMHYGDEAHANIHGTAKLEDAQALLDEGIAVASLPIPIVPPDERN